jgi:hypothetical protein
VASKPADRAAETVSSSAASTMAPRTVLRPARPAPPVRWTRGR